MKDKIVSKRGLLQRFRHLWQLPTVSIDVPQKVKIAHERYAFQTSLVPLQNLMKTYFCFATREVFSRRRRTSPRFGLVCVIGMLLVGSMLLSACANNSRHFKLTAEVEVNGVIYTGKGVLAMWCHEGVTALAGMDVSHCMVKGEAVVVEVGKRGLLVITLRGKEGDMTSMVSGIFHARQRDADAGQVRCNWDVPPEDLPLIVTFADPTNPKSVIEVNPAALEPTFGPGAKLRKVSVQCSNGAITWGELDRLLPWMTRRKNLTLDGNTSTSNNTLSNRLSTEDFRFGR